MPTLTSAVSFMSIIGWEFQQDTMRLQLGGMPIGLIDSKLNIILLVKFQDWISPI